MSQSVKTLLILFMFSALATLACGSYLLAKEFAKPLPHEIQTGLSDEPHHFPHQNKIEFSRVQFTKIGPASDIVFTLSESRSVSQKEMQCLAKNIYHEARGEGIAGMMGVAQITLNRADSQYQGRKTICSVVSDKNQFSWTANSRTRSKRIDNISWQQSQHIAQLVLLGLRIKGLEQSVHFHARKSNPPGWAKNLPVNKTIGNHTYLGLTRG